MDIEYRTGDIFKGDIRHVVHGCNTQKVMGSGIARTIRDNFPEAYEGYRSLHENQGNSLRLGQLLWVDCGRFVIGNAITQKDFGNDPNTVYVSYDAIFDVVERIDAYFEGRRDLVRALELDDGLESVAFPLIGAGLANGSWTKIAGIIEARSWNFQPVVYLFDGKMPTS